MRRRENNTALHYSIVCTGNAAIARTHLCTCYIAVHTSTTYLAHHKAAWLACCRAALHEAGSTLPADLHRSAQGVVCTSGSLVACADVIPNQWVHAGLHTGQLPALPAHVFTIIVPPLQHTSDGGA